MDLALNNLQWLICHKTQTNKQYPACYSEQILQAAFSSKQKLYCNLSIVQTIKVKRQGHAEHNCRSKKEFFMHYYPWTHNQTLTFINSMRIVDVNQRNYKERWRKESKYLCC